MSSRSNLENEDRKQTLQDKSKHSYRKINSTTSAGIDNDEFERLVRMGLGQNSLMMRKDRRGIAI